MSLPMEGGVVYTHVLFIGLSICIPVYLFFCLPCLTVRLSVRKAFQNAVNECQQNVRKSHPLAQG